MATLSTNGRNILGVIWASISSGRFIPDDPRTFLGYKEVHDTLNLSMIGETWGQSFLHHGGLDLAQWAKDENLPAVTGLVIDRDSFVPGGDYFRLYGRRKDDIKWWLDQVSRAAEFDWHQHLVPLIQTPFVVGKAYSRPDIYRLLAVPEALQGGDWNTGSHKHGEDWFVFATVGTASRTGHDYDNYWEGNRLVWRGRTNSRLDQPKTQAMITDDRGILIFSRVDDRIPFTFEGRAVADGHIDSVPVTVYWRFPDENRERTETLSEELTDRRTLREGAAQQITVLAYERNPEARRRCIELYGYDCAVCGFNFAASFGELGKEYIQVHHLRELSSVGEEYEVDPAADLRPVCPNCHAMLHRRSPVLSIEDLKRIIAQHAEI